MPAEPAPQKRYAGFKHPDGSCTLVWAWEGYVRADRYPEGAFTPETDTHIMWIPDIAAVECGFKWTDQRPIHANHTCALLCGTHDALSHWCRCETFYSGEAK